MLHSFGNRADMAASDEPFYGAFLHRTGIDHPMREEVMASMETDADSVAATLQGRNPDDKPHWYQKHMCHELPFDPAMLSWKPGLKPFDGVWAAHWYNAVLSSTGFAGEEGPLPEITHPLLAEASEHYEALRENALVL